MKDSNNHTELMDEFTTVLIQITDVVTSLTETEQHKADAAANNRHDLIDSFLNPEQAMIMKLRGLEQKRLKLTEGLGWKGLTFRQLLDQADSEQREVLAPLFTALDDRLRQLTDIREASDRIIQLRLRELQTALGQEESYGYDSSKQSAAAAPGHFRNKYV